MPHVQITLRKGRTPEQKQKIAKRIADALVEEAGVKREWMTLSMIEVDDEGFAVGGSLVSDLKKREVS